MECLYAVELSNKEYVEFANDILRMVTIQFVIQFLYFLNNPVDVSFFSVDFFLLVLYVSLGVCVYWLVIKKLIMFK